MKLTFLILTTFFALTYASQISTVKSSSIIDSLTQLLYIHLYPIFQNTLQQLIQLVFDFSGKLSQYIQYRSIRSDPIKPAPWVSQLFGDVNAISAQWNNQVTQFFTNIPTIFENDGRSLFNFAIIKEKLHQAVENLLEELKKLFVNNIDQSLNSIIKEFNLIESISGKRDVFDINTLLNILHQQISDVFYKTKEQLNRTINDSINVVSTYLNDLKDRFFG